MIKTILKVILILALYETMKYIAYQVIIIKQANDDVDVPVDFDISDQIHLNEIKAEVSD